MMDKPTEARVFKAAQDEVCCFDTEATHIHS